MARTEGASPETPIDTLSVQAQLMTPEPAVHSLTMQHPPPVRKPSLLSEGRLSQVGAYSPFPLSGATLLARAMRRASLEDLPESPHILQLKLQLIPSAPLAPAMLHVDTALSLAMSETYFTEMQSDHSMHEQLSALAEAYLQHTAGRSSDGADYLPGSMLSPDMRFLGLGPQQTLDVGLFPELSDLMDPSSAGGFGWCHGLRLPPAGEAAWKLTDIPEGSPILADHGRQAWSISSRICESYRCEKIGSRSGGAQQRLQQQRACNVGQRRLGNTFRRAIGSNGSTATRLLQQLSVLRTQLSSAERRTYAAEHKASALTRQLEQAHATVNMISSLTGVRTMQGCLRNPLVAQ